MFCFHNNYFFANTCTCIQHFQFCVCFTTNGKKAALTFLMEADINILPDETVEMLIHRWWFCLEINIEAQAIKTTYTTFYVQMKSSLIHGSLISGLRCTYGWYKNDCVKKFSVGINAIMNYPFIKVLIFICNIITLWLCYFW